MPPFTTQVIETAIILLGAIATNRWLATFKAKRADKAATFGGESCLMPIVVGHKVNCQNKQYVMRLTALTRPPPL
jgi:hypothetical protein